MITLQRKTHSTPFLRLVVARRVDIISTKHRRISSVLMTIIFVVILFIFVSESIFEDRFLHIFFTGVRRPILFEMTRSCLVRLVVWTTTRMSSPVP